MRKYNIYQYEEKASVCNFYHIAFDKVVWMEFTRWRKLATRYKKSLEQMFNKCALEGTEEERKTSLNKTRFFITRHFCRKTP